MVFRGREPTGRHDGGDRLARARKTRHGDPTRDIQEVPMIRCTAFASLAVVAALAAAPLAARAEAGNVVGGGGATLSGGGDNMVITYSTGGAGPGSGLFAQSGRLARFAGSHGDGSLVEYLTPAVPADPGREAWLVVGGDNAEVVSGRRR